MAPPKRYWAKLKLSPKFLGTLPEFPAYMSKSRLKRLAQEERRSGSASINSLQRSSPAPEGGSGGANNNNGSNNSNNNNNGGTTISNYKVNMGLKEGSTSGLTMNSITSGQYALDKSGKPCKRWVKKPRQFKSFTGFKVTYVSFEPKDPADKKEVKQQEEEEDVEMKEEVGLNASTDVTNTPAITPAPTPLIKTES
ncbi:hypothetical protein Cantr_08724 [Candida viswanathii]|uniref:INO80 complex subunit 4 n=1 Tax=Candida viswanathii TaxID=5486 RepID=A0A367Y570_9ASCO|nr:hypothetical protein Cantr_08724 [Candida viswanathii]